MKTIDKKYKELKEEILWRFKTKDYKEDDKCFVVIRETIDKDMSFISISDVEKLSNELGTVKLLELQKGYVQELGEFPKKDSAIDELRLLLYWYFELRVYNDEEMRKALEF